MVALVLDGLVGFSQFFSFVSQFFSCVSQAGRLWSGSRWLVCLPLLFTGWALVVGFPSTQPERQKKTGRQLKRSGRQIKRSGRQMKGSGRQASRLVSGLFRWQCNISIHLFSRSVTAGVRPFPLGMQHFYSFVSRVCHWCCRPFPLAM